ncbi:hypothetical protein DH2020_012098 [Rehmannia glutinosa]|uniref:C2H2-type domain-containing protein n=1 Tax=Rehmannia glutinosa TaxID=99300 RepID=A0ABR0XFD3_REHGL
MAEEGYESRFVCKLCNKKYPCGKSLGGHMRSHVIAANTAESEDKFEVNMKKNQSFDEFGNGQSGGYVLRENPKKTWRAVDSRIPLSQDKICKQCGKGFHSMKALCGHMACHSERDKGLKDDNSSWTSENQKMVMDTNYNNNGSSSVSEIDGQEQEEVAMSLMLLSRDFENKGGVNSVVDSSDNNSVVLETKSSSIEMRIGKMDSLNYIHNQDEIPQMKEIGDKMLKDAQMENSDSGYFLDECAKAESDVSVDGFRKYGAFGECKKIERRNEYYRSEFRKSLKAIKDELLKLSKDDKYDDDNGITASYFGGIESRKRKYGSENHEFCDNSLQKKSKYECYNCKKTFKSYQALGGHRPCHKRTNAFYESRHESGENSLDDSTDYRTNGKFVESSSKKKSGGKNTEKKTKPNNSKGHVCPFCSRVFKNGQALGGHKRSHFIVGHEERNNNQSRPVTKTEIRDLLDLNLPAPEADEDN